MRRPCPWMLRALALAALATASCIERAPNAGARREEADRRAAAQYLVTDPRPAIRVGAQLSGIELVGLDVDPPQLHPGDRVTLTLYWRALEDPDTRWSVFVHLDAPGTPRVHGDHAPAGGRYPTNAWRRGEVVRDPVVVRIPARYPAHSIDAWIGLFSGTERSPVTLAGPLGQDGQDRVLAARLPVHER